MSVSAPQIRQVTTADLERVLALNLEFEHFLSPLDLARLKFLHSQAAYHRVVLIDSQIAGFLLAFREGADYDSLNYRWFSSRYEKFLYIDRISVAAQYQRKKLGAVLYDDVFEFARQEGVVDVTAEYYVVPRNEPSERFHDSFGFKEVGSQWVADGTKRVSLRLASSGPI